MPATASTLGEALARRTSEGELYEKLPERRVRCFACGHRCLIPPGRDGICRVRFNEGGVLRVPRGYVGALQVDPIEKKPFFHALPGARALSFGMLGCDFHCGYCQNWVTSQALSDPAAVAPPRRSHRRSWCAWRGSTARASSPRRTTSRSSPANGRWRSSGEAKAAGLVCSYVSNGNGTPEVLDYIRPGSRLYKVDLKGFRDRAYRDLGGTLERVLETIRALHERGILAGDRDPGRARLQRLAGRAQGHRGLPGLGLARHPVARDGVPPRLQNDEEPGHGVCRAAARRRRSASRRDCASSTPATSQAPWRAGRTPGAPAAALSSWSASASMWSRTGWPTASAPTARGSFPECGASPRHPERSEGSIGL